MNQPSIATFFEDLPDPRVERTRRHLLLDIIVISILAVIAGADSWEEIAHYGHVKQRWLEQFLRLPAGIPSAHTFRRVFTALDVEAFNRCFIEWAKWLVKSTDGKLVAIDGKTLRGSYRQEGKKDMRHIVSAWVGQNHVVFGQLAVEEKSNEITAIPRLIEMLELRGATVTIDAMGCQHKIVDAVIAQEADYLIAVKDNQPKLAEEVETAFATAEITKEQLPPTAKYQTIDTGHGRHEVRTITVLDAAGRLSDEQEWTGLRSLVRVESERTIKGKRSQEERYYISSATPNAQVLADCVRGHWGIENTQHWTLDVAFDEDRNRTRSKNAPDNFAILRRIALNILKAETSKKRRSMKLKRHLAGWDDSYLLEVLESCAASAPG